MNPLNTTTILCAAILAFHGAALAGGDGWTSDYADAKKQAAESKKDLLIDFTGSDWCPWCIKLNDEVFKQDAFKKGVKDSFVLVEFDFPKDTSKLSEETQKRNQELADKYGVQHRFPLVFLTDAAGAPYAMTGYQEGGPEKYVEHLNELRTHKAKRDEAFAAAEKATGVDKAKALITALKAMELEDQTVKNFYGDIPEKIKAADPKDETGFQKMHDFQVKLQELGAKQDLKGAMELVDKTLKDGGLGKQETQEVMVTRGVIFAQEKKFDEAIKAIDEAKAYAPDSPMNQALDGFRKRLEDEKQKAKDGPKDKPAANPEAKPAPTE